MARVRPLPRRDEFRVSIGSASFWSRQEALDVIAGLLSVYEARHGMTSQAFWQWTRETPWERARPLTFTEMRWMTWFDIWRSLA